MSDKAPQVYLRCNLCSWRGDDECTMSPDWMLLSQITSSLADLRIHQEKVHGVMYKETTSDIAKDVIMKKGMKNL